MTCLPSQPLSPTIATSPIPEEEDEDLNKAFGVQRFQQILSPTSREPNEHRHYNEEDFQCEYTNVHTITCSYKLWAKSRVRSPQDTACKYLNERQWLNTMSVCVCPSDHRHSSHHTRHPLSKHTDGRRKRTGKKKRGKERHLSDDLSVQDGDEEEETNTEKPESETHDSVQVHSKHESVCMCVIEMSLIDRSCDIMLTECHMFNI